MKIRGMNPLHHTLRNAAAAESMVKQEVTKARKKRRRDRIASTANQQEEDAQQQSTVPTIQASERGMALGNEASFSRQASIARTKKRAQPGRKKKVEPIRRSDRRFRRIKKRGTTIDVSG